MPKNKIGLISASLMIWAVASGCASNAPNLKKMPLSYDTYSCAELKDEKSERVRQIELLEQPKTLELKRKEAIEKQQYIWGLISSWVEGKSVRQKIREKIALQRYYIDQIEQQLIISDCQEAKQ
ncbi:MAG: hypothetical protein GJ680_01315 [Alteromonadaceae bacterium]|nr:hypothetical protein [Alteromonadaceae bacterium]